MGRMKPTNALVVVFVYSRRGEAVDKSYESSHSPLPHLPSLARVPTRAGAESWGAWLGGDKPAPILGRDAMLGGR